MEDRSAGRQSLTHLCPSLVSRCNSEGVKSSRRSKKEHRNRPCAFVPPRVPRPVLYNHVATVQMQGLAELRDDKAL